MRTGETPCRSILVPSKLPDADYVANPYVGCTFGCTYCYASFMARQVNESRAAWGTFVYAKTGAIEAARRDLDRLERKGESPSILLSSVTDPYQGIEGKLRLTQGLLSVFVKRQYRGRLSILTKSPLVERDASLIQLLPNAEVGLTVTIDGDPITRRMEAHAPPIRRRIETLRRLSALGISTYAFIGPIFPHVVEHLEQIDELFSRMRDIGVRSLFVEHLNASSALRTQLAAMSTDYGAILRRHYQDRPSPSTTTTITSFVEAAALQYGLRLRTGKVIQHDGIK